MNIAIGADHGGVDLKAEIVRMLKAKDHAVTDFGTQSTESVDYPDFAEPVARRVADGSADFGILICRTGIGMALAATKFPKVRAVAVGDVELAQVTRRHNNANILCLGADRLDRIDQAQLVPPIGPGVHAGAPTRRSVKEIPHFVVWRVYFAGNSRRNDRNGRTGDAQRGPQTDYALTFKLDHSSGTDQSE